MTERYLGSSTITEDHSSATGQIPPHLPPRLTVTLWDFSWYTRAGEGEPYSDLDRAVSDAASLGYNAIRICAAPMLLFAELGLEKEASNLAISGMGPSPAGGYIGERTRWYDVPGGFTLDLRARLAELFAAAQRHSVVLILASWEYQQSPAFAATSRWFDAIDAVPLADRYGVLARAWDRMIGWLTGLGHRQQIALVELHNEVDFSILPALEDGGAREIAELHTKHPDLLITASYGKPPHLSMHSVPAGLSAGQFHIYSYGVLDALQRQLDIRSEATEIFPNRALSELLRPSAPSVAEYGRAEPWRYRATVVTDQMFYGYDHIDPERWDLWLYEHYGSFHEVMRREIESRVTAVSAWARWKQVPLVIGEGWVGYTPLLGSFEEGPVGRALAEWGVEVALANGAWGVVLGSNAAPHHPMWEQRDWQRHLNAAILART